jgi:hypothetical protein
VATSIAAFVGWATKGPANKAVLVESWMAFQSQFGGLSSNNGLPNYLGYAVSQFFANGGQTAYILRIVWDGSLPGAGLLSTTQAACAASATAVGSAFALYASSPGSWGNNIWVKVIPEPSPSTSFTVQVLDGSGDLLEDFANLSVSPADPRYVVTVINSGSSNVTFVNPALPPEAEIPPPSRPNATPIAGVNLAGGLDGPVLVPGDVNFETALGADNAATSNNGFGVSLLNRVDIFNLLCVPGETDETTILQLQQYCVEKRAFYIVDCPHLVTWDDLHNGKLGTSPGGSAPGSLTGADSKNSAYYYPWVLAPDPLANNNPAPFPPSGFVAGIYASTDSNQGVWRAPAGIGAGLAGVTGLLNSLTDLQCGDLTGLAINCLREFEVYGDVVWGARTLAGSDQAASQWKYVPIRRFALFLESSLYAGTQWVVFEPNGEPLWSRIRSSVGSFMQGLFLTGALQGTTPQEAFFVRCDSGNNTQSSIDQGVVNITVGFAPLYPAEFVIIQIAQLAGQQCGDRRTGVQRSAD